MSDQTIEIPLSEYHELLADSRKLHGEVPIDKLDKKAAMLD